jgi:hypothetical protein
MNHLLEAGPADDTARESEALAAYASTTTGTPASSWAGEENLEQHFYDKAFSKMVSNLIAGGSASTVDRNSLLRGGIPVWQFDHVLNFGAQRIVVETFGGSEEHRASILKRVYAFIGTYKEIKHPLLIVVPIQINIDEAAVKDMNVGIVQWVRGDGFQQLEHGLKRLAG